MREEPNGSNMGDFLEEGERIEYMVVSHCVES